MLTDTPSLLEWSNAYLDFSKEKFSTKTYLEKRSTFRRFFSSGFSPGSFASSLSPLLLLEYFQRQARERSGNAANKDRKNLSAAWSWGVKFLNFPLENPFQRLPRQSEKRFPRRVPSLSDFWKVYDAALQDQDKRLLLVYLYTGARRSELFRLRWQDVDFEACRVRLYTKKNVSGSYRASWVSLTEEAVEALHAQHVETGTVGGFVFIDPGTGGPYMFRLQWMRRLCDRAGVERFGFHGIRHLCASILAGRGVPLVDIQHHLRHENLSTTQRYIHQLQNSRAVLDALSGLRK